MLREEVIEMMFKKDLILAGRKTVTSRDKKLYEFGEVTNLMANSARLGVSAR